eukprot:3377423-Karenia_brevis.AAC.1
MSVRFVQRAATVSAPAALSFVRPVLPSTASTVWSFSYRRMSSSRFTSVRHVMCHDAHVQCFSRS